MHQRRPDEKGDITGQTAGDVPSDPGFQFPDWDNPEDWDEDAPEGYYEEDAEDEEEEEDDGYIPGPEDPDYDLSEAAGYANWDAPRGDPIPQWLIAAVSILLILSIAVPAILILR